MLGVALSIPGPGVVEGAADRFSLSEVVACSSWPALS